MTFVDAIQSFSTLLQLKEAEENGRGKPDNRKEKKDENSKSDGEKKGIHGGFGLSHAREKISFLMSTVKVRRKKITLKKALCYLYRLL